MILAGIVILIISTVIQILVVRQALDQLSHRLNHPYDPKEETVIGPRPKSKGFPRGGKLKPKFNDDHKALIKEREDNAKRIRE